MISVLLAMCLTADAPARDENFSKSLSQVEFVGSFTTGGTKDSAPKSESYTIIKVEKLPQADLYRFLANIKYGETDVTLPMDLPVLWAGNTPVITLDNVWLPGLGTFSARVVIHDDKYAGTWRHDEKGGHLFGIIRKLEKPVELPSNRPGPDPKAVKATENKP